MDIEIIKKEIFDDIFASANDSYFVLDPHEYANDITRLILECEGENNCHKHNESFKNIDISQYLSYIKEKRIECVLILAITNKIEGSFVISGEKNCIHAATYFENRENSYSAIDFIIDWHGKGAKICNYHNHPLRIAAISSDNDIEAFCPIHNTNYSSNNEWNECVQEYGIDLPKGFRYSDWGVITPFDFFSYTQHISAGHTTDELIFQNKENQKKKEIILSKYEL